MKNFAAINKDPNILKISSSGGVFYELAKYTLDHQGIVFGATGNKDGLVDIKGIDNMYDLPYLMGSKYIKANVQHTFQECKDFLNQGKLVLYCGLGCQLHALRNFLGQEYKNLILCEVCCHGTMPVQIGKDYLQTIQRSAPIVSIEMRNKEISGENWQVIIKYEDGHIIKESLHKNKYIQAFLSDKYLNKSCYNCSFKNDKTVADLIIGDFWGIRVKGNPYEKYNNHKGCSFIRIANEKLLPIIESFNLTLIPIEEQYLYRYNGGTKNTIDIKKQTTYNSGLFKKRCGIITLPLHNNIGGILQTYALQQVLKSIGCEPETLNRPFKGVEILPDFCRNIKLKPTKDFKDLKPENYDLLVVGSDQILRPRYAHSFLKDSYLDFAKKGSVKKIIYAGSLGSSSNEYNKEQLALCKPLIKQFAAISTRETSGVKWMKEYMNTKAEFMPDPTMLLPKEHYLGLCYPIQKPNKPFFYILDDADKFAALNIDHLEAKRRDVQDGLTCFRDCSYVVTDSFHGCVFSIIFNKPFICVQNKGRGMGRFETLQQVFDLQNNFINTLEEFDVNRLTTANQDILFGLRQKGINGLKDNING